MNKLIPFPGRQKVFDQASLWLVRIDRELNDEERKALKRWLAKSHANRQALLELVQLWGEMDSLRELADVFPLQPSEKSGRWRPNFFYALAASFALFFVIVGLPSLEHRQWHDVVALFNDAHLQTQYETTVGEQMPVTLPDGSIVTLNTDTHIAVEYGEKRLIHLLKGEAYFEVSHTDNRVFVVSAGDSAFQAVGTAFNVKYTSPRKIALTVTDGTVKLNSTAKVDGDDKSDVLVNAGKAIAITDQQKKVTSVDLKQVETLLAWKRGVIVFDREPLADALLEFNRYSTVKLHLEDQSLTSIPVAGYFLLGDVEGLLASLDENFAIESTRQGKDIILRSRSVKR